MRKKGEKVHIFIYDYLEISSSEKTSDKKD